MAGLRTTSVVAHDAPGVERALAQYFPTLRLDRVDPAAFRARVATVTGTAFSIADYAFEASGSARSSTDQFTVVHSAGRDFTLARGRDAIDCVDAFLAPRDGLVGRWSALAAVAIALDPVEVGRVARAASGRDDLRLRHTGWAPRDDAALGHWSAVVADLRDAAAFAPELFDEPMIERSAFEQLATAFLHAFPTTWHDEPEARAPAADVTGVVRRALEYMHAHAATPVTVRDIADAVPITTRGLHYAFTRELGRSPREELRRIRLESVRRELLVAEVSREGDRAEDRAEDTDAATVREVARRWGFAYIARFRASYEAAFGESPEGTLRA